MSTTMTPEQATPNDGSLTSASQRIEGLLSGTTPDTERPETTQPEQRTAKPTPEKAPKVEAKPTADAPAEQAPAASEEQHAPDASEPAAEAPTTETPAPRMFTVTLPGGEKVEVAEDELVRGYSRTQDYTRKTMELAKQRKEFEERDVSAVRQERESYKTMLTALEHAIEAVTPKEPNWAQLRAQLPIEEYIAKREDWDTNQKQLTQLREEKARVERQQMEDAATGFKAYVEEQHAKLIDAMPDFGDPTKAPTLKKSLNEFATSRGFSEEELNQVTDHRLVLLLHDAMQYRQQQAKAPAIKTKIEQAITTPTPGGSKANAPKSTKHDQARDRLRNSGRLEDAAVAIEGLI